MSDVIFKLIMGTENSIELLTDFLFAVLNLSPDEYDEIIISNPFLLQDYKGDKLGILDVKLKLKSSKIVNIEIQVEPMPFIESRILFYVSKLVTEQIGEGEQYDKIKRVISIIITDHHLIKGSEKYHHHFGLYDIESKILLTDALEIHTLELPKARKVFDSADAQNDRLLDWMKFFDIKTEEELKMVAKKSPIMKKATLRLLELSADEKARQLYEARLKERRDSYARERGIILSVVNNAFQMKMSTEDIAKLTGLTNAEIESLRKV